MSRIALHVDCKQCGTPFDTGIRTSIESFRKGSFIANYHRCPACGARETFRKADYVLVDTGTGAPVAAPTGRTPRNSA